MCQVFGNMVNGDRLFHGRYRCRTGQKNDTQNTTETKAVDAHLWTALQGLGVLVMERVTILFYLCLLTTNTLYQMP